jgi:ubiquinone/menaquinone biosynthesis C-methylase UbiE
MQMNRALKLFVNGPIWDLLLTKHFLPKMFSLIDKNLPDIKKALEIGSGIGTTSKELVKHFPGINLIATDFDNKQVKIAGRRLSSFENIIVEQADASDLSFTDNSFDAVFCFNSLHHIEQFEKAIQEASRVLVDGGHLYIIDEGVKFFNPVFRWVDQPVAFFAKNDIIKTANSVGLQLRKEAGTERLFYLVFQKK